MRKRKKNPSDRNNQQTKIRPAETGGLLIYMLIHRLDDVLLKNFHNFFGVIFCMDV